MGVSLLLKVSPDAGVWGEEASAGWDLHTALAVRLWVSPPPRYVGFCLPVHKKAVM